MFLNQKLKEIQEAKNKLVICSDLRRLQMQIEVRGIWSGIFNTVSGLTVGLAITEQLLKILRERKNTR